MKYKHLVVGGTFDLMHAGHEAFLQKAFGTANKVSIGLTSDSMAARKGALFQNYRTRKKALINFLHKKNFKNWQIIKIDDSFGIATFDKTLDAILVSSETKKGAIEINKQRKTINLKPLKIILTKTVLADGGRKISSGRIKNGEIDQEGLSYFKLLTSQPKFLLPSSMRTALAKPLGQLFGSVEDFINKYKNFDKLFVVGDASVVNFLKLGIVPSLSIIDLKIERRNVYKNVYDLGFERKQKYQTVDNAAGEITRELSESIYTCLANGTGLIKVIGEEDLAVLPLVLLAPLENFVVYGQRGRGIVIIYVTEQKKVQFLKILEFFSAPTSFNK